MSHKTWDSWTQRAVDRGGVEIRVGAKGECRCIYSVEHTSCLGLRFSSLHHLLPRRSGSSKRRSTAFLQSDSTRVAPRLRPDPISYPEGREREVPTCTCGSGDRLLFHGPPPSRCRWVLVSPITWRITSRWADVFLRSYRRVGRLDAPELAAGIPPLGASQTVLSGKRDSPKNVRLLIGKGYLGFHLGQRI